jgi:hypothetical protein
MSHFTVLVIERPGMPTADQLLAPYDENTLVVPYPKECYCAEHNLFVAVQDALEKHFSGDLNTIKRTPYNALPEEDRPEWKEYIADWVSKEAELNVALVDAKKPDLECEECSGTGTFLSQYNPFSKWDWFELGGRWTGFFTLKDGAQGELGEPSKFKSDPKAAAHTADRVRFSDIDGEIKQTFAFITPNGKWHEKAHMGWWAFTSDERPDAYNAEWNEMIASLQPDDTVCVFDAHI